MIKLDLFVVANRLGVPLTVDTKDGKATLSTVTVNDTGISAGYVLPSAVHKVVITGTLSFEEPKDDET